MTCEGVHHVRIDRSTVAQLASGLHASTGQATFRPIGDQQAPSRRDRLTLGKIITAASKSAVGFVVGTTAGVGSAMTPLASGFNGIGGGGLMIMPIIGLSAAGGAVIGTISADPRLATAVGIAMGGIVGGALGTTVRATASGIGVGAVVAGLSALSASAIDPRKR